MTKAELRCMDADQKSIKIWSSSGILKLYISLLTWCFRQGNKNSNTFVCRTCKNLGEKERKKHKSSRSNVTIPTIDVDFDKSTAKFTSTVKHICEEGIQLKSEIGEFGLENTHHVLIVFL